ncbi:hypothetical protein Nepgr_004040 [Nepenthes gracilis]|uniref:Uncharacterized protein n=1 Tax=Nepenthes gracilis TaxID=150966 RepID=A0AAD3S0L2_NEPGR|nr:hypothetical protein Nepgr_004040 [Nepenthes gracilis]
MMIMHDHFSAQERRDSTPSGSNSIIKGGFKPATAPSTQEQQHTQKGLKQMQGTPCKWSTTDRDFIRRTQQPKPIRNHSNTTGHLQCGV